MALILGSNSAAGIKVSPRYNSTFELQAPPVRLTDSVKGGAFDDNDLPPLATGRSISMVDVIRGAATMKMISSTSITSTIGVTLISAITAARRRPRRPPPPDEPAMFIAMILISRCARHLPSSRPLVDLAGQDG